MTEQLHPVPVMATAGTRAPQPPDPVCRCLGERPLLVWKSESFPFPGVMPHTLYILLEENIHVPIELYHEIIKKISFKKAMSRARLLSQAYA